MTAEHPYCAAMANAEKLAQLENVPLFRACTKGELKKIARLSEELRVPADKVLVRQGAIGREFFFILDGEVQISRSGKEVAVLGAGGFFGELALLVREPRDATATTLTPSVLLVIGQREFGALLADSPTIARKLLEGMAQRLRDLDRQTVTA